MLIAFATGLNASWLCGQNPVVWIGHPNLKNCAGSEVTRIHGKVSLAADYFHEMSLSFIRELWTRFIFTEPSCIRGIASSVSRVLLT